MASLQVSVHRTLSGGRRVILGVARQRGGPRDGAPVVQDPGNMHDLRGLKLLCAAQDQVVVLAALEPAPKASDIAREIGPDGREVADIVLAAQPVGIPITRKRVVWERECQYV